ncbi:virulence factor Mce family protein [Hartmannibacter diazotrophicus]|uniref:Virulence factor Mce family protein n=1 Tax=Hartmannibacter diazotrophicus TaxID=1482074 RepID=A0A2C9D7N3_9HYPH|nr:MCE family protein [Hartmannibacter diazotrophicus]SON56253.1 virulence factor Mce family protein [Hartmannibacter diazotrophicus]
MESRANYAMIGSLVLLLVAIGVGFVLWLTNAGEQARRVEMRVVFNGAVNGLTTGSPVLFNGIRIGEVKDLQLDQEAPSTVIAIISVDRTKPIRTDTKAVLTYQGFTGIANLQLEGGSRNAPLLIDSVDPNDGMPTIQAEVSPFQDIIESARNVLSRADSAMGAIDDFISDNGPAFGRTVNNVETFSKALADNSGGVGDLLQNLSDMSKTVGEVSGSLKGSATRLEEILKSVNPDEVQDMVANLDKSSQRLSSIIERAGTIADGINPEDINGAINNVADAAEKLNTLVEHADTLVASVDPKTVTGLVDSARSAVDRIGTLTDEARNLLAAVDRDKVSQIVDQVDTATRAISDVSTTFGPIVADAKDTIGQVGEIVKAVEPDKVRSSIDNVNSFTAKLAGSGDSIDQIVADAKSASASLKQLGDTIDKHQGDVDQTITNVRDLSEQLNGVAKRADSLLVKLGDYVEGTDSQGLITEATEAAKSIREVADTINKSIGPITSNVTKFSDRGLGSFTQLAIDGQNALARLNRVLSSVERDPQQFIFGSPGVPEYAPRRR